MPKTTTQKAYLKLILAIVAWAGVYHSANYLVKTLDPYTTAFVRYFIASIILVSIVKIRRGKVVDVPLFKANWILLLNIGIIGIGLYNIAFFGAEQRLSAQMVVLIFSFSPCLTALLASIFMKQRLGFGGYLGLLIALSGTIGVINFANPNCGQYFCLNMFTHISSGEIYAFFLCTLSAIFSLLNRVATERSIDSLTITTSAAIFGCLVLFIMMLVFGDYQHIFMQSFKFWLAMAYTAVIGSVMAYFWYSEAIKNLGVANVVVFLNGIPFVTILIGVVIFGEPVALTTIFCGAVIISGVILTNFMIQRRRRI